MRFNLRNAPSQRPPVNQTSQTAQTKTPVTIKKYANRRLYNTETSTYVTLDDLAEMVRGERDFVVFDAKTGEDLTHSVLTQIILEQEGRGQNLLPVNFLRQLIRFYGDSMGKLVPSYLDMSIETLAREQERFRKQMTETWGAAGIVGAKTPFGAVPFGAAAIEAMQEQTRHNMALFEKAMSMWSPFTKIPRAGSMPNGIGTVRAPDLEAIVDRDAAPEPATTEPPTNDISALQEQLAAMQKQLDRISRGER
jgi:polyhydroxyalkanoate synthesis repressor PhaR